MKFLDQSVQMLAHRRAGQRDGRRRRQADVDFGGWVKTTILFVAISGQEFMKFWDDLGDPS